MMIRMVILMAAQMEVRQTARRLSKRYWRVLYFLRVLFFCFFERLLVVRVVVVIEQVHKASIRRPAQCIFFLCGVS